MKHLVITAFCCLPFFGNAAENLSPIFSKQFKTAVDAAMSQQTSESRTKALIAAMHSGTDEEVFSVLPLLFTPPILAGATKAGVCSAEIQASAGNVKVYLNTPAAEQPEFITANSKKIRADTDNLIRCICQYYRDGKLYFPGTQPEMRAETLAPVVLRLSQASSDTKIPSSEAAGFRRSPE